MLPTLTRHHVRPGLDGLESLVAAQQVLDLAKGAQFRREIGDATFHFGADPERIVHQGNSDVARHAQHLIRRPSPSGRHSLVTRARPTGAATNQPRGKRLGP